MRMKAIKLSWFRGAADPVSLEPNCKSMVVYGVNGSGKSSFVDAVEYVLKGGKIRHLAHEYSGKRQEKAILNTRKPQGRKAELMIRFKDDSELKTEIGQDGSSTSSGAEAGAMNTWDYRRTVLRQDEIAEFIHDTKGGKYSALLPLLGLHSMEIAAENLRQLAKVVEEQSNLKEIKYKLLMVATKREATFGTDSDSQILAKVKALHATYCADKADTKDPLSRCKEVKTALEARIAGSSAEQRRHVALQGAAALNLKDHVDAVRAASVALADAVEPLIKEKLEVLQSTRAFAAKLGDEEEVDCPACGQRISVDAFQAHAAAEQKRLGEVIKTFEARKAAIGTLCGSVASLQSDMGKADVEFWRAELAKGPLADNFTQLNGINAEALRQSCGDEDLETIEEKLLPLIEAAASDSNEAPPDAQQLATDKQVAEAGEEVIAAGDLAAAAKRSETLAAFIASLEKGTREEIRLRSKSIIAAVSADIQAMWTILHPGAGEAITHVCLHVPAGADKAIDISLKFYGVEQESPRLTLSEGYRNSLGLCIFLAMAKREADKDRPIFLDDVVISLDRNHRGMIVELLEQEFGGRQVIILTHDREWYTELRQQLDKKNWIFKTLLPYETPDIGIRWSHKTTTFDDARAQLKERPDAAGNDARKIMDVELALFAERLKIRLPYRRADKNDQRMAHEFLERFAADGNKCFQKKEGNEYKIDTDAIDAFERADALLTSWANRASHTFDLEHPEATKLIDACEKAIGCFTCSSCEKLISFAPETSAEWAQCQCGELRWRYGKA